MRVRICLCFILVIMIFSFGGCGGKKEEFLEDTYIEGQDYQYMFASPDFNFSFAQKGENGYYLINNGYRIYYDPKADVATPLCNQVDCLHDKEENEKLQKKCHARYDWFEDGLESQIQYYNGDLYMLTPIDAETGVVKLMKYPEDGSEGSVVRTFKNANITYWIIHRGYMYFCSESYSIEGEEDGDVDRTQGVFRCSVIDDDAKSECIFIPDEDCVGLELATIQAYGNHIYFFQCGFTEAIKDKDYKEYLAWRTYHYDIRTKKVSEIQVEEQKDNKYSFTQNGAGCLSFVDGKLLFAAMDIRESEDHESENYGIGTQWYFADLDGSNQTKALKTDYQYDHVFCDDRYIYVDNQFEVEYLTLHGEDNQKPKQTYKIYDKQMHFVDEITMPFEEAVGLMIGDKQYQFLILGDEASGINAVWNKDDIGKNKGKFPNIKEVYKVELATMDEE